MNGVCVCFPNFLIARRPGQSPRQPIRPGTTISAVAEHSSSESWAEIGVKVGGDNESLRNLLTDVSRRIEALDDLREIFGAAVTPIGEALASLEHEKFDNIKLRSLLEDINTRHQALRGEHAELRKQSVAHRQEGEICAATWLRRKRRPPRSKLRKPI